MSLYVLTPQAEDDLFSIWSYIAGDNRDAADRVEDEVYASCSFLAAAQLSGHIRQDLTDLPLRFWTMPRFRHYVLVYDPNSRPLRIIRILHSSLDIPYHLNPPV